MRVYEFSFLLLGYFFLPSRRIFSGFFFDRVPRLGNRRILSFAFTVDENNTTITKSLLTPFGRSDKNTETSVVATVPELVTTIVFVSFHFLVSSLRVPPIGHLQ